MELNEKLIELVRKHKVLYDFNHKLYKNTTHKLRLWEDIAKELNIPSLAVRNKWKTIRDGYVRHKKQMHGTTGSGRRRNVSYLWAEQLNFLDDTLQPRETTSNVTSQRLQQLPPEEHQNTSNNSAFEITLDELSPVASATQVLSPNNSGSIDTPSSRTPRGTDASDASTDVPTQTPSPIPFSLPSRAPRGADTYSTYTDTVTVPTRTSSPAPVRTPQIGRRPQKQSDIEKAIEFLKTKRKPTFDSTDHLFLSYASTFKKLCLPTQTELKVKLAQLFANAELNEFANNAPPGQSETQEPLLANNALSAQNVTQEPLVENNALSAQNVASNRRQSPPPYSMISEDSDQEYFAGIDDPPHNSQDENVVSNSNTRNLTYWEL